ARPPPARRPRAPLLLPAPRTGRRGRGRPGRRHRAAGRGPQSGFRAATGAGTGRRGRRAVDSSPGHRTGPLSALSLCPGPEKPAPSRPFERWILLTYLAALASRVESWVLPDRTGLVFVTLGQPRILPELESGRGEVGRAGRSAWVAAFRGTVRRFYLCPLEPPTVVPPPHGLPRTLRRGSRGRSRQCAGGPPHLAFLRMCKYFAEADLHETVNGQAFCLGILNLGLTVL
ncbi:unnamed protein product, partial [Rangifer tarandus platyrhynchus]